MDLRTPERERSQPPEPDRQRDRLGAEVRESALLLGLSLAVTAGVSAAAQALLALAG